MSYRTEFCKIKYYAVYSWNYWQYFNFSHHLNQFTCIGKNNRIQRKVKCQYLESGMPDLDQVLELSLVCLSFSIQQAYFYLKHSKFVVPFQQL